MPHCPLEIRASAEDNAKGAQYFAENKEDIRDLLLHYGAIWFRGFDLMKSVAGNREMHEAIPHWVGHFCMVPKIRTDRNDPL